MCISTQMHFVYRMSPSPCKSASICLDLSLLHVQSGCYDTSLKLTAKKKLGDPLIQHATSVFFISTPQSPHSERLATTGSFSHECTVQCHQNSCARAESRGGLCVKRCPFSSHLEILTRAQGCLFFLCGQAGNRSLLQMTATVLGQCALSDEGGPQLQHCLPGLCPEGLILLNCPRVTEQAMLLACSLPSELQILKKACGEQTL